MTFHLPPRVMIIDSDAVSRKSISNTLERVGFNLILATSGDDALKKLKTAAEFEKPNLIIVDNNISDLSGIELCTILRAKKLTVPIILIAIKEDEVQPLKGITSSFNDYLIKPINQEDLHHKINILLRKSKPSLQSKIISFNDIEMNLASYKVTRAGREIHLGPTEFKLLQCFMKNPAKVFSRKYLIEYIWDGQSNVESRTIDVHINRLRTSLKLPYERLPIIKTVRCAGYCLNLPEKISAVA
ncbi:MAG: winged helix-turn-helix domain-containing protein [Rickettsiales bacterium]|nr:winged helix-turn-helix domain-containing protein [Rickettsiales bacterium]